MFSLPPSICDTRRHRRAPKPSNMIPGPLRNIYSKVPLFLMLHFLSQKHSGFTNILVSQHAQARALELGQLIMHQYLIQVILG